ncbi:MAG: UvrD-helicase domain-containing protein, partial [bacterium]|nr:UvrD-helicase domain-containing protein [bacterium]
MFNLDTLNENQQRAVTAEPGPVLVIAGAGTGKTRTLTHRIAYLIKTNVVKPEEILAITFTNKAASEMNERVEQLLGESQGNEKPFIGTFHRFCNQFLRKEAHHAGRIHGYAIYGASEQRQLVSNIMKKMVDKTFKEKISNCLIEINRQKMRGISPEEYAELPHANEQIVQVYKEYELALIHQNAMDFEDLLAYTNKILTEHPEVCAKYQDRFKAILVDEYQDTNAMQYSIVKNLARRDQNIFAVGDFDQTIYSWRGANVQNILQFEDDFKNTQVVRLEENYRSTKRILDCANHLITFNKERKEKELNAIGEDGDYPSYVVNFDEKEEAEYISQTIQTVVKNKEFTYNDVAILYRTNAQSRTFEEVMNRSTVPHRIVGSLQFYQRQEIKDIVAILQCVANPSDNLAFQFAIARPVKGVGAKAIEILSEQSKR